MVGSWYTCHYYGSNQKGSFGIFGKGLFANFMNMVRQNICKKALDSAKELIADCESGGAKYNAYMYPQAGCLARRLDRPNRCDVIHVRGQSRLLVKALDPPDYSRVTEFDQCAFHRGFRGACFLRDSRVRRPAFPVIIRAYRLRPRMLLERPLRRALSAIQG